ncbi:MAG TPA: TAT-variant-translocated molybdopterin oxidoreductase [Candidatus Limnocylindria bacterium]|nr:TAT-variant-translocated molybdopterin oxidoreductase [Candidatus Limnocylindria bacterium]
MSQLRPFDLEALRRHLAAEAGAAPWRSLDELAGRPEFIEFLNAEFPQQALALDGEGVDRRHVLKLMAASLALAGLGGCTRQPEERLVPFVRQPEHRVPGKPVYYATSAPIAGFGVGVLAESHEGRPTKIEGNPDHPASLGATDAVLQAAVLGLYDPDRSQVVTQLGDIRPWSAFVATMEGVMAAQRERRGAGLRILTGTVTSPTLASQLTALLAELPEARWHQWEPLGRDAARAGALLAFGEPLETRYRLEQARVVLSLDADILGAPAHGLRYTRELVRARRGAGAGNPRGRLYVVEPFPSCTGALADHRLPLRRCEVDAFARALARRLGIAVPGADDPTLARHAAWIDALARDLRAAGGEVVVAAGEQQPPAVHALAHAMNHALGAVGRTVEHAAPVPARWEDEAASLASLVEDMQAGRVDVLVMLGCNPVFTAPADLRVADALAKVPLRIHHGLYDDETAALCHWHLPEAHFLEAWSDVRAYDGTASVVQPLIAPLYEGRTAHDVVAVLAGQSGRSSHELVREHWRQALGVPDFEIVWQRALRDGVIEGTSQPARSAVLRGDVATRLPPPASTATDTLELVLRPDPYLLDGRFANNGWLQELPRPLTKVTWDNAAYLAPATAARLGLANEQVVELALGDARVEAPVWIVPGVAAESVTLHLGYGRRRAGRVGTGIGVDVQALRTRGALWGGLGLTIRPTRRRHRIACTQDHFSMEGRDLVRRTTVAALADGAAHDDGAHEPTWNESLYDPYPYEGHRWGMVIDLATCIGCNACVAACTAENNVAVVGKDQVLRGREMQWLRVDRYFDGPLDDPALLHQPVPCMHCETAPCEVVCPVNATVHSSEGLNEMVYNRCVGTRYCSNNCPYKVRRFNFYLFQDWNTESYKLGRNPDVTVRSRGVMEKCTYCVQRIEEARITAMQEGRTIRDGDIVTACQQACPADAIVFGDLNDPSSKVAAWHRDPRNYSLLAELGTRPRTTYLGVVRDPNPALAKDRTA